MSTFKGDDLVLEQGELLICSSQVRRRRSSRLTSVLASGPALTEVDDSASRVAVMMSRPMQHGVVTLAADCTPFRLDAGFVGLPLAVCSRALGGFVGSSPIEAEGTALCLGNDGGPFLWCL